MDHDKKLPDALGGQQLKGRRPLGRHLQQIQPCTCQSHCQRPERLRLHHTSCWVFVELVLLNELGSRVSSGLRWTFLGELAFIAPMAISVSNKITLFGHNNIFHRSAATRNATRECSWTFASVSRNHANISLYGHVSPEEHFCSLLKLSKSLRYWKSSKMSLPRLLHVLSACKTIVASDLKSESINFVCFRNAPYLGIGRTN